MRLRKPPPRAFGHLSPKPPCPAGPPTSNVEWTTLEFVKISTLLASCQVLLTAALMSSRPVTLGVVIRLGAGGDPQRCYSWEQRCVATLYE